MIEVDVHTIRDGRDVEVGTIRYDEDDGTFHLSPTEDPTLVGLMQAPVFVGGDDVYAEDDPELFMTNLCRHYRGHLRASEARED